MELNKIKYVQFISITRVENINFTDIRHNKMLSNLIPIIKKSPQVPQISSYGGMKIKKRYKDMMEAFG